MLHGELWCPGVVVSVGAMGQARGASHSSCTSAKEGWAAKPGMHRSGEQSAELQGDQMCDGGAWRDPECCSSLASSALGTLWAAQ